MRVNWVLGGTGLLGSAIRRQLLQRMQPIFTPSLRINWSCPQGIERDMNMAVNEFSLELGRHSSWTIFWAAGVGAMGSSAEEFLVETQALATLLNLISNHPRLRSASGRFVFASSAGAIYANSLDLTISESSAIAPSTAYAHAKLQQEALLREFQNQHPAINVLLARLSTVYGPGQAHGKQQGLIAMIARRMLRNQIIHIYVPFDTLRDYIAADDASAMIIRTLDSLPDTGGQHMRIIATGKPTSIAQIVHTFRRIAGHPPRISLSHHALSHLYAKQLNFQSAYSEVTKDAIQVSLPVGIARVFEHERRCYSSTPCRTSMSH